MHPLTELDYYFPTFEDNVLYALTRVPYQDDISHPIESILRSHCSIIGETNTLFFVKKMLFSIDRKLKSSECIDLLKIVIRLPFCSGKLQHSVVYKEVQRQKTEIVVNSLRSDCIEMRTAGIEAVLCWKDEFLIEILKDHSEPVTHLSNYKNAVIDELT
ncbi:MAG: hypothetical protein MI923_03935 [Phycisphaerales bacterium]|nr:hypothetical protein [Phycisphaerales bacterium]